MMLFFLVGERTTGDYEYETRGMNGPVVSTVSAWHRRSTARVFSFWAEHQGCGPGIRIALMEAHAVGG